KRELSRFLVTRGVWLIVLEFTVVRFAVGLNLDYGAFPGFMQVIFALGVSMIVLAALIHLPLRAVTGIGLAIVVLHNLLDGVRVETPASGVLESMWMVLHQPGIVLLGAPVFVLYPVLPWIGVMALGYALGSVYQWPPERRRRFLLRAGLAAIAAFVAIRAANVYGDPARWSGQDGAVFTLLSFLNTSKYPPSLLFLLMTLGPALLALAWFERTGRGVLGRALVTFGRVPLFFYVLQWLAAHALAIAAGLLAGQTVAYQFLDPMTRFANPPPDVGFGLEVTYLLWLLGVLLLYPLCRWFAGVKRRRSEWWLSYL
ncbi:MAG TPA: heparan-alpha-glucosaminide N-acetyltransferase domain-containing protein, partial [Longimicrobiaceae bacterium]|nr:heparan-alpha-glucosaminide N-acetyltransferase domain-containing protein [Longimicrobiaceae bacterium]